MVKQVTIIVLVLRKYIDEFALQALVLAAKDPRPEAQAIFESTFGILFLGTPHHGAWPSALGKIVVDCSFWLGGSSVIMDDIGYQSTKLKSLADKFLNVYKNGEMICIYETKKTYMCGILPIVSSSRMAPLPSNLVAFVVGCKPRIGDDRWQGGHA